MRPFAPARTTAAWLPLMGAWLWGALEFVALARSRWIARTRDARQA